MDGIVTMHSNYMISANDRPHPTILCVKSELECVGSNKILMQNGNGSSDASLSCMCRNGHYNALAPPVAGPSGGQLETAQNCQACLIYMTSEMAHRASRPVFVGLELGCPANKPLQGQSVEIVCNLPRGRKIFIVLVET